MFFQQFLFIALQQKAPRGKYLEDNFVISYKCKGYI